MSEVVTQEAAVSVYLIESGEGQHIERVKLAFESKPCSRCGGSGHHSFNLLHGSVCYGCGGKGIQETKRGAAAHAYWRSLMMKPTTEVKVGDKIFQDGWRVVQSIERRQMEGWSIKNGERVPHPESISFQTAKLGYQTYVTSEIMSYDGTVETWNRIANEAARYQESLTKAGTVRKAAK